MYKYRLRILLIVAGLFGIPILYILTMPASDIGGTDILFTGVPYMMWVLDADPPQK